jgi:hypothetical protein
MLVRLENGKLKDVRLLDVTPQNYIVPEGEEGMYHCLIEVRKFNAETGERLSKPRVQKFNPKMYRNLMAEQLRLQGYTTTLLYDPTEWLAKQKEREARLKTVAKQTKAEAGEAKQREIDEAVAKAVAKALANVEQSKGKIDADKGNLKG